MTGNTISGNTAKNNTGDGIQLDSTCTGNTVTGNTASGNGEATGGYDFEDDSTGGIGPGGINNEWHANHGQTSNPVELVFV